MEHSGSSTRNPGKSSGFSPFFKVRYLEDIKAPAFVGTFGASVSASGLPVGIPGIARGEAFSSASASAPRTPVREMPTARSFMSAREAVDELNRANARTLSFLFCKGNALPSASLGISWLDSGGI